MASDGKITTPSVATERLYAKPNAFRLNKKHHDGL